MVAKKQTRRRFTTDFKKSAIERVNSGALAAEVAKDLDIPIARLTSWMKVKAKGGGGGGKKKPKGPKGIQTKRAGGRRKTRDLHQIGGQTVGGGGLVSAVGDYQMLAAENKRLRQALAVFVG